MPKGSPGQPKSAEHKHKLRDAAKRRYADPQERQAQSARMKSVFDTTPALQRMHSVESRQKHAKTMEELWNTPSYKERMLAFRQSDAYTHHMQQVMKDLWANPEHQEKMKDAMRVARQEQWIHPELINDPEWIRTANERMTLTEMAEYIGCSQSCMSRQFAKFGIIPKQHPVAYTGGEEQVITFLRTLDIAHIIQRDRNIIAPYEIDIYLPDHHLGIEYHGTFWHSYNRRETASERRRHQVKHAAATAAGVRLLQFWDTEWQQHPGICQNIIQGALGKNLTIGARECELSVPLPAEVKTFLEHYHLQGVRPYTYVRGLYYQNELVMVMTIGKSRFKANSWELLRLATKSGLHISGGVTKLWGAILTDLPSSGVVYSYADKRLFAGTVYQMLGFQWSHDTPPGYSYWLDGQLYSRLAFQKHKLATHPGYDDTLTEAEHMFARGYRRLWDAGQSVWVYNHYRS